MNNLDFTLICSIKFFDKKRKTKPNLGNGKYCPHIMIKGDKDYLGVCFIDGEDVVFDRMIKANALPMYENVDYSCLTKGMEFFIIESSDKVGEGIIEEVFHHVPAKDRKKY